MKENLLRNIFVPIFAGTIILFSGCANDIDRAILKLGVNENEQEIKEAKDFYL